MKLKKELQRLNSIKTGKSLRDEQDTHALIQWLISNWKQAPRFKTSFEEQDLELAATEILGRLYQSYRRDRSQDIHISLKVSDRFTLWVVYSVQTLMLKTSVADDINKKLFNFDLIKVVMSQK